MKTYALDQTEGLLIWKKGKNQRNRHELKPEPMNVRIKTTLQYRKCRQE